MKITSPAFLHHQPVPVRYTCQGSNVSPPLEFSEIPENTESFALILEDIDSSNNWIHWLVYNIPGTIRQFEEGKIPEGSVDGVCNGGTHGYEGPCPIYFAGTHRYRFLLYALDCILDVPYEADSKVILERVEGHILDTAVLVGMAEGEQVRILH